MKLGILESIVSKINQEIKPEEKTEKFPSSEDEKILISREKSTSKKLGGGCNQTVFVELRDDGKGVFKPKNGEKLGLRDNIESGTYYKRERAAYLVDVMIGFDLVPPTVIRDIDGEVGSMQRFVDDAEPMCDISSELRGNYKEEMKKMWLFDYIIWNSDRHTGNFLGKDKKIYAIDNGLSFGSDSLGVYNYYYNENIPQDTIDKIKNFLSSDKKEILLTLLKELIPANEAEACIKRVEKLDKMIVGGIISEDEHKNLYSFH